MLVHKLNRKYLFYQHSGQPKLSCFSGEKNIKGVVYVSCLLAQIDALQAGNDEKQSIEAALKRSLDRCLAILRTRVDSQFVGLDSQLGNEAWSELMIQDNDFDWSDWFSGSALNGSSSGEMLA